MAVIRLFRFRAARLGFDEILRHEMLPDLAALPGVIDCVSARQGPDALGPRIVASIWVSRESMVEAVGDRLGVFHPERLEDTSDQVLEVLDVMLECRLDGTPASILRVLRGQARPGELLAYVQDVRHGLERDAREGHAPTTLYLADAGGDGFVTVSTWREWADIEAASGGDIRRPTVTRQPERLVAWDVEHYEIVRD